MSIPSVSLQPKIVHPVAELRASLSKVIANFREQGIFAEPLIFGSHRKPEGVVISYSLFEKIMPAIEESLLEALIAERLKETPLAGADALNELGIPVDSIHTLPDGSVRIALDH
jgi:PHD/YefM family antitoxin component YafN of YafNO toxin-antitoxin module